MIVDDDADFAGAVAAALRNSGHEVNIELDTTGALKSMNDRPPDLAILDVIFPQGISAGFELARTMRRDNERLRNVPILMLTAVNQKFPLGFGLGDMNGESLSVDDFLEKPVDLDVLRNRVASLLARAGSAGSDEK